MKKGESPVLTTVIMIAILISALAIVLSSSNEIMGSTVGVSNLKKAEAMLVKIDNAIQEVVDEGPGSTRSLIITNEGEDFEVFPKEDMIQYKAETGEVFQYLSRQKSENIMKYSGADVNCNTHDIDNDGIDEIILENTYLYAAFQNVSRFGPLDTAKNIELIKMKKTGIIIMPTNTSIIINDNPTTSAGTGRTELLYAGTGLVRCKYHVELNTTAQNYDIYYTLRTGADFLEVEVKTRD